jgi:Domain of unknown function (4846)
MHYPGKLFGCLACSVVAAAASAQPYLISATSVTVQAAPVITVRDRFETPTGCVRIPVPAGSFGTYLRSLSLRSADAQVHLFDGRPKNNQGVHAAVIDMSVGDRDLQQCADAVMRLRAEFLFAAGRKDEVGFHFTNGFNAPFARWTKGERIRVQGNDCSWTHIGTVGASHDALMEYLQLVFTYAGTLSLSKELKDASSLPIEPGDVFIHGGSPGHAVIVVDVAQNAQGQQVFMLAQSYMPAQEIHVLKNLAEPGNSPWYVLNKGDELNTPEWRFAWSERKRW